jgi:hypothetical protein
MLAPFKSKKPNNKDSGKKLDLIRQAFITSYDEELVDLRRSGWINVMIILTITSVGAAVMAVVEGWGGIESFYWAAQTITTVGYGDVTPKSNTGKICTVLYILIGCGFMAKAFADFTKIPIVARLKRNEIKVLDQFSGELTRDKLEMILSADLFEDHPLLRLNSDRLARSEFVLLVLTMMNKVEEKDIILVSEIFSRLDGNDNNFISAEDLEGKIKDAREEPQRKESMSEIVGEIAGRFLESFTGASAQKNGRSGSDSGSFSQPNNSISNPIVNSLSRGSFSINPSPILPVAATDNTLRASLATRSVGSSANKDGKENNSAQNQLELKSAIDSA